MLIGFLPPPNVFADFEPAASTTTGPSSVPLGLTGVLALIVGTVIVVSNRNEVRESSTRQWTPDATGAATWPFDTPVQTPGP